MPRGGDRSMTPASDPKESINQYCRLHGHFEATVTRSGTTESVSECRECRRWKLLDRDTARNELNELAKAAQGKTNASVPPVFSTASFENFVTATSKLRAAAKVVERFAQGVREGQAG